MGLSHRSRKEGLKMAKRGYMTLSDYALIIGKTEAETEEILKNTEEYKPFFVITEGRVLVDFDILNLSKPESEPEPEETTETEIETPEPAPASTSNQEEVERLKAEIEALKITIKEKDKQIIEYGLKFADLAQQAQQIASQAQYLQLTEKATETQKQGFFKRLFSGRKGGKE